MIPHKLDPSVDLPDDLGCDPFDCVDGEVIVNGEREVRVGCRSWLGSAGVFYQWIDPATGVAAESSSDEWGKWAGEQVWILRSDDGTTWRAVSPFSK